MALWEEYTHTNVATYFANLAAFAATNGWTVSTSTATALTISKAGVTFIMTNPSANSVNRSLSYAGITSAVFGYMDLYVGQKYGFISCGNNLFFYQYYYYYNVIGPYFGGVMQITDKIGAWSGGVLLNCCHNWSSQNYDYFLNGSMSQRAALFRDGAWTTIGAPAAGRPWASIGTERLVRNPNFFNAATMPVPILVGYYDTNTAYVHPLGYAPCVYRASRGDVYAVGDIITISGEQYIWHYNNLLFKVS